MNFSLFPGFLFSGALPPLDLELAGVKLQAPSGAAMTNGMISIPKVALTLPPSWVAARRLLTTSKSLRKA